MLDFQDFIGSFESFDNAPLAEGGQKVVFKARHATYGEVVVKVLKENNERVQREIQIVKENNFDAVPKIFETVDVVYMGQQTEVIIEEFVSGTSLRSIIESGRRFSLQEAVDFLEASLDFLIEISDRKIVHRDIKPENIMLVNDKPVFLDFGIARVLDASSLTQTGFMGPNTPGYAAPELFNGLKDTIDGRSDLFSIGVVTYELITGKNPFRENARSVYQIYQKTVTVTPVSYQIPGDTQAQFMGLLSTLMNKQIAARPRDARQALQWLDGVKKTFI